MRTVTLATLALTLAALLPATATADNPGAEIERAFVLATHIDDSIGRHAISGDGTSVVFGSQNDLLGTNADGNMEIFLWNQDRGVAQLTDSTTDNFIFELDIDYGGDTVAALLAGDPLGQGAVRELYRWTQADGFVRLTVTAGGMQFGSASISDDGRRILFNSKADYTGENPDRRSQAFFWEEGSGLRQLTFGTPCNDIGGSFGHDVSGDGSRVLFTSRCQFGDTNQDLNNDIFLWDETDGVQPLSDRREPVFAQGRLNRDGTVAAFTSQYDLASNGSTGSHLYRWTQKTGFAQLSTLEVTAGDPDISEDGLRVIYAASNGQGGSVNPEGTPEIFMWRGGPIYDEDNRIVSITDSSEGANSLGISRPRTSSRGDRIVVITGIAFDPPTDPRQGLFVIDVVTTVPARRNLLANGEFDSGLGGWKLTKSIEFSADDATLDPASGSALQANTEADADTRLESISQCVTVLPGTPYVLSGMLRGASQDEAGIVRVVAYEHQYDHCDFLSTEETPMIISRRSDGAWVTDVMRFATQPETLRMEIVFMVEKTEAGGSYEGGFDHISLRRDPEGSTSNL